VNPARIASENCGPESVTNQQATLAAILAVAFLDGTVVSAAPAANASDATIIRITDTAAVTNVERLGMNFWGCSEAFGPNMPLLKKRVQENFEGSVFRRFTKTLPDDLTLGDREMRGRMSRPHQVQLNALLSPQRQRDIIARMEQP
jgi:hypothetical protein